MPYIRPGEGNMESKPGVGWCLIPPFVLADDQLSNTDKLIFGRIWGLTNEKGYCFASNDWIGKQINASSRTVSRSITKLNRTGYISVEIVRGADNVVKNRKIFFQAVTPNLTIPHDKNDVTPHDKNGVKSIRDKSIREENKKTSLKSISQEDLEQIAEQYNVSVSFVSSKYDDMVNYCESKGKKYKDYRAALRNWVKRDAPKRAPVTFTPEMAEMTPDPDGLARIAALRRVHGL